MDLYLRVRLACHVERLSQREAASRFGIARDTMKLAASETMLVAKTIHPDEPPEIAADRSRQCAGSEVARMISQGVRIPRGV